MSTYLCARGTVYLVEGVGSSTGLYKLESLQSIQNLLLLGAVIASKDAVSAVSTLNDEQIIYTFGKDFGNVSIRGEILLGNLEGGSSAINELIAWFQQARVSTRKEAETLSFAGGTGPVPVFITGMVIGMPDIELNILPFEVTGVTTGGAS